MAEGAALADALGAADALAEGDALDAGDALALGVGVGVGAGVAVGAGVGVAVTLVTKPPCPNSIAQANSRHEHADRRDDEDGGGTVVDVDRLRRYGRRCGRRSLGPAVAGPSARRARRNGRRWGHTARHLGGFVVGRPCPRAGVGIEGAIGFGAVAAAPVSSAAPLSSIAPSGPVASGSRSSSVIP